jgi:hypothetical protein
MRVTMSPQDRAAIKELDAKVIVVQDEVLVDVVPSTGGAGMGLIGAIVDSSITSNRVKTTQNAMGPFYAAIEDIDFRQAFFEAVKPGLSDYPLKVSALTATPIGLSDAQLLKWREGLGAGQRLLIIVPRYVLSSDFRNLDVQTVVTMWQKEGENKPINRGLLRYQSALLGAGGEESMNAWSANGAAAFRTAVKEAVAETIVLVRADIDAVDQASKSATLREFLLRAAANDVPIKGRVLSENANRVIVLGADEKLYSLPKSAESTKN